MLAVKDTRHSTTGSAAVSYRATVDSIDELLAQIEDIDLEQIVAGLDPIGTTSQPPQQSSTIHSHVLPSHTTSSSTASSTTAPPLHSSTSTSCSTNQSGVVVRREKLHPPRTDAHRFSRANLEESGDVELDAILGELCALESQFDKELLSVSSTTDSSSAQQLLQPPSGAVNCSTAGVPLKMAGKAPAFSPTQPHVPPPPLNGSGKLSSKFDSLTVDTQDGVTPSISRTDSPDNDSAFSDSLSVLSSESSASSAASNAHRQQQLALQQQQQLLHGQNDAAQLKAEKIKLALEKIKEANVKKLFLKAFSRDGSSKSLLVDEKMTVAHVTRLLADKNHVTMDPKWTIVEHLPDLYMERVYEDDEMLVENLLLWARDSKNKLFFLDRPEKYVLFWQPENYLIPMQSSAQTDVPLDDEARNNMIEEFFSSGSIPEVEGPLFLKSEGKKAWKKFYFVLRGSGLYYCPKGKSSRSSRDLVCLVTFENNQVYQGFGWRKKHKAPTDWGFAIKPAALQTKSSKYIKYLCTDEASIMYRWIMAIRIAKCGNKLLQNYRVLVEDLAQEDIDLLASSRSFSLASVAATSSQASQATTPSSESRSLDSCLASSVATSAGDSDRDDDCDSDGDGATPVNTLNRSQQPWGTSVHGYMDDQDIVAPTAINNIYNTLASTTSNSSSSSSGCLSHRSNASTPSTEHGFESEFSQQGTIKRKPSAAPKIPLTNTTRHMLHEQERDDDVVDGVTNLNGGSPLNMGSLRLSLRRSLTDDSSSSAASTLKRRNSGSSTLPRGFSSKNNKTSTSGLPSMPAPSCQSAEVDGLPLPPPPLDLTDSSLLPPPPPELLASNLSLASSLPPPPEDMSPPNPDEMSCSMISLPPPPPPLTLPLASNMPITSHKNSPPPPPTAAKPKSPTPPPVAPKPRRPSDCTSPAVSVSPPQALPIRSVLQQPTSHPPVAPKKKRITFKDDVQNIPPTIYPSSPSPPSPCSPNKPPPPPRSDSTKLSNSPQKHPGPSANKLTPPKSFLSNLQKVMQKKWQVAEKCKDFDQTPHEVLGFRDSIPQTETERNVGLWIQEHYGCIYDHLGSSPNHNLYDGANNDNDSLPSPPLPSPPPPISPTLVSPGAGRPVSSMSLQSNTSGLSAHSSASRTSSGSRKKPPPPLPKRADSTQLSSSVSPRQ